MLSFSTHSRFLRVPPRRDEGSDPRRRVNRGSATLQPVVAKRTEACDQHEGRPSMIDPDTPAGLAAATSHVQDGSPMSAQQAIRPRREPLAYLTVKALALPIVHCDVSRECGQ